MGIVLHSGFAACNIRSSFGHGGSHSHSHGGGHGHSHNHGNSNHHQPNNNNNNNHNHHHYVLMEEDEDYGDPTFSPTPSAAPELVMRDFASDVGNGSLPDGRRSRSSPRSTSCFNVSDNLNVRAAFVHVVGDLLQSIGVFVAAIIIKVNPDYKIADPICTFIFSVLVLCTTLCVLKDVLLIILEGVPSSVDYEGVKSSLMNVPGVRSVHSLNIWSITVDKVALSVHLAVCNPREDWDRVLKSATAVLRTKHDIFHPTVQVEPYDDVMRNCQRCNHP